MTITRIVVMKTGIGSSRKPFYMLCRALSLHSHDPIASIPDKTTHIVVVQRSHHLTLTDAAHRYLAYKPITTV